MKDKPFSNQYSLYISCSDININGYNEKINKNGLEEELDVSRDKNGELCISKL